MYWNEKLIPLSAAILKLNNNIGCIETWQNVRFKTGDVNSKQYVNNKLPLANFRALSQSNVVDILRKESDIWINELTGKEIHAVKKYTYNLGDKKPNRFFERLNAMLRGDREEDKKLRKYANIISGALGNNRLKYDIICYRSINFDAYKGKKAGDVFKERQFISTSVVESRTLSGKFKIIIYAKKGTKAAYIEQFSAYPKQRELLLDKDTNFKVISKKEDLIELEVI